MYPNDVVKISLCPDWASSRITRSASAPSGTFSTYFVVTLPARFLSIASRAMSCWCVQPASPIGLTYTKPILSGSFVCATAGSASARGRVPSAATVFLRVMRNIVVSWEWAAMRRGGIVRRSFGMVRLAERRRRVEADRHGVAGDEGEHDDRREEGQHRAQLRRHVDAGGLRLELRERHAADQVRADQHAPRLPRGEDDERERDPAAPRRHAFDPRRRIGDREKRPAHARARAAEY